MSYEGLSKVQKMIRSVVSVGLLLIVAAAALPSTTYNSTVAMTAWKFCKPSSCSASEIRSWTCPSCLYHPGMKDITIFENATAATQGYSLYDPTHNWIVLAFRGSHNIENWIEDFIFDLVPYPNPACRGLNASAPCLVHKGFLYVFESMQDQITWALTSLFTKYGNQQPLIMVTGHSLGAATALLTAVDIVNRFQGKYADITLYNFGEPRVGNPSFAYWAATSVLPAGKQFRVTHAADPVPRVPPLEFGYLHAPHEIWYNNDLAGDNFQLCSDSATAEDLSCSMSQFDLKFSDHSLYLGMKSGCGLD